MVAEDLIRKEFGAGQLYKTVAIANPPPRRRAVIRRRRGNTYIIKFLCTSKAQATRILLAAKQQGAKQYLGHQ